MPKLAFFCLFLFGIFAQNQLFATRPPLKVSSLGAYKGYSKALYKGVAYQSQYLDMPDGVKLATDVFLPKNMPTGRKIPTIIYFVRYVRSLELKWGFRFLGRDYFNNPHVSKEEIAFFTSHGYACMVVDLRGSGASFGHRKMEFSPEEVEDMRSVMDWVVAQKWSDGKIGTTGVSYTGTTAEFALSTKHPALKASIPRCSIFDLYEDMTFPGGIRQAPFIDVWKFTTQNLDKNNFAAFGGKSKLAVKGANPVNGQSEMLKTAVAQHAQNYDIFAGLFRVHARDEVDAGSNLTVDDFSAHSRIQNIRESNVPIYRISGWYDGGNVNSCIKGYRATPNTKKMLIGAWDHGPSEEVSPFGKNRKAKFDIYAEMLRFFDFYIKGVQNGIDTEPPIYYYQMGQEEFLPLQAWEPSKIPTQTLYLSAQNQLSAIINPTTTGATAYKCDYTVGTGGGSRWNSLTPLFRYEKWIDYPNRAEVNKKMLVFDNAPATENMQITGHPVVDLYLSADATDATVFVYLEDIAPNGKVTYITEGMLKATHRKISTDAPPYPVAAEYRSFKKSDMQPLVPNEVSRLCFDMLPISYLLQKGHRLRVSIASSDDDHFEVIPESLRPKTLQIHHNVQYPSQVKIPVIK